MSSHNTNEIMQALARGINDVLNGGENPPRLGFFLLVSPMDTPDGIANYVSTIGRADAVKILQETARKLENKEDEVRHAALNIWVVYSNTTDYPGQFVARRFENNTPTDDCYASKHLGEVQSWIQEQAAQRGVAGPIRMDRHPTDDPVILETWL